MSQLDRYIFFELLSAFAFFFALFTGILWITQAISILDFIVETRQSGVVFLELSLLHIPRVWLSAIGMAGFASAIYITNRLYSDSELTAIMAAGRSTAAILRPFFMLSVFIVLLLGLNTHYLQPYTSKIVTKRQHEITQDYVVELIRPGRFVTEASNTTMYFGGNSPDGVLSNIFIEEHPNEEEIITYFAQSGQLIKDNDVQKLVMFNGSIHQKNPNTDKINVVQFDSFAYDLSSLHAGAQLNLTNLNFLTTPGLLKALNQLDPLDTKGRARHIAILWNRHAQILQAFVLPLLAASIMLFGTFRRSGIIPRILLAIAIGVGVDGFRGITYGWVSGQAELWPTQALPALSAIALILILVTILDQRYSFFTAKRAQ